MPLSSKTANYHYLRVGALSVGLLLLIPLFYPDLVSTLHKQWTTSGELDFGYLVLIMAIGVVLRTNIKSLRWQPTPPLLLLSAAGALLAFVGLWLNVQAALMVGLIAVWWGAILACLGRQADPMVTYAAALLLLTTPLMFLLIPALRGMTVLVVTNAVALFDIVAYAEENYIHLPSGIIEIANGCSGTKYFHSAMVLAFISLGFGFSKRHWLSVIGILAVAALVANWIRVFILVVWAYYTSVDDPLILDHDWLGWVVFAIAIIYPIRYVTDPNVGSSTQEPVQAETPALSAGAKAKLGLQILMCGSLLLAPMFLYRGLDPRLVWQAGEVPEFSAQASCQKLQDSADDTGFVGADLQLATDYRCASVSSAVTLSVYQYLTESQGKELVYWTNGPFDTARWKVNSRSKARTAAGRQVNLWRARDLQSGRLRLAAFDYQVGETSTTSRLHAKALGLLRLLPPATAPRSTAIEVNCAVDCAAEEALLVELFGQLK